MQGHTQGRRHDRTTTAAAGELFYALIDRPTADPFDVRESLDVLYLSLYVSLDSVIL
jgi:hypothetical protein